VRYGGERRPKARRLVSFCVFKRFREYFWCRLGICFLVGWSGICRFRLDRKVRLVFGGSLMNRFILVCLKLDMILGLYCNLKVSFNTELSDPQTFTYLEHYTQIDSTPRQVYWFSHAITDTSYLDPA